MRNKCERAHVHPNAWLVRLGEEARLDGYVLTIDFCFSSLRGIQTGTL
jgi:hypothetical protein